MVTYKDDPMENIWFSSVVAAASEYDIVTMMPDNPKDIELRATVNAIRSDYIFSFYYRYMLITELLAFATRDAYNMYGSLPPKYCGRAAVNWAVLNVETEIGTTLSLRCGLNPT